MSAREAVEAYIDALRDVGADILKYQFRVIDGKICLGHVWGVGLDEIQWAMIWHTPEEFSKMARMRRLDSRPTSKIGNRFVEVDKGTS
jgi:hypothetical protein